MQCPNLHLKPHIFAMVMTMTMDERHYAIAVRKYNKQV